MSDRPVSRLSLAHVFLGALAAVAAVTAGGLALSLRSSRRAVLEAAERSRVAEAARIEERVTIALGRAERALADLDGGFRSGAIGVGDPASIEPALYTRLLSDSHLAEIAFTRATELGFDEDGEIELAADGRFQVSVVRVANGHVQTRITEPTSGRFSTSIRERSDDAFASPARPSGDAALDPTEHATFSVLAAKGRRGRAIWSDLHYAESDALRPVSERRVVLSVQKALEDGSGRFLGVARVSLLTSELDAIAELAQGAATSDDSHRIALLCVDGDEHVAHLVARVDPSDRLVDTADGLRFVSDRPPAPIAALLASPLVRGLDPEHPSAGGTISVGGVPFLATLRELRLGRGGTTGWLTAVVVPESVYTRELERSFRAFTLTFVGTLALVVAIGALALASIRRGLRRVVATTAKMRGLDFAPSDDHSAFRELDEVTSGLERAKTVARGMQKYVPLELVRALYASNREPTLGGEPRELSMMFTDIEGFTTLAEKLPPHELAARLGDYLDAMTVAIHRTGGTIDKFIGDAVMALWNAPTPVEAHARAMCAAVLDCQEATRKLYASERWGGLAPMITRFGIHRARVLVGNFGAPERLSYTALGDGVNLAARLEPLCKQYGVVVLASETVVADVGDAFVFRRIDRVAVKGKTKGIDVYELLGRAGSELAGLAAARKYEEAFDAYLARDFERARTLLADQRDSDPPSAVLALRCEGLLASPPPDGWDGVHVASSK